MREANLWIRVIAGASIYIAWLLSPFRIYAGQAGYRDFISLVGLAAGGGLTYICFDWLVRQRKFERSATLLKILGLSLSSGLLLGAFGVGYQAIVVRAMLAPSSLFQGAGPEDGWFWFHQIDAIIISPLFEEVVFRAWLLGVSWSADSLSLRIAVSCIIFPFGHLVFDPTDLIGDAPQVWRFLLLMVASAVFTAVWFATRSILACFFSHSVFNGIMSIQVLD